MSLQNIVEEMGEYWSTGKISDNLASLDNELFDQVDEERMRQKQGNSYGRELIWSHVSRLNDDMIKQYLTLDSQTNNRFAELAEEKKEWFENNDMRIISKQYINKTLIIHVVDDEYGDNSYTVRLFAFNLDIDEVYLPMRFEFDKSLAGYKQIEYIIPNDRHGVYSEKNIIFKRDLLENKERDQQTVFKDACTRLQTNGSILLALKTGFGKTDIALNFCRQYKLKTVMITSPIFVIFFIYFWRDF